jgi:DNA-binding MarR family transcriptional regulator
MPPRGHYQHIKTLILELAEKNGMVTRAILKRAGVSKGSCSVTLINMKAAGWLRDMPASSKATRIRCYELTEAGRLLLAAERARLAGK